jgi:hypothetical protein
MKTARLSPRWSRETSAYAYDAWRLNTSKASDGVFTWAHIECSTLRASTRQRVWLLRIWNGEGIPTSGRFSAPMAFESLRAAKVIGRILAATAFANRHPEYDF